MPAKIETQQDKHLLTHKRGLHLGEETIPIQLTKKPRVAVRFAELHIVKQIPNRHDFSADEKDATWYSKKEMSRVKYDTMVSLRAMNSQPNADIGCTRGLEMISKKGFEERRRKRRCIRAAVFGEQEKQRLNGYIDDQAIAAASENISFAPKVCAAEYGINDFDDAVKIYQGDKDLIELFKQIR
mmetsp:Transcript_16856/g.25760  ORF Transcript_16856/g.25760 Transcript_16856/m.25760 type:complete len:184 (-) Transcript_16856:44-595(-)|eukprot:CAMPEP_0118677940 /NCGR_PEP_ID=MMETSP0800-20121206/2920_1 /TAXON_ID=210618 ORGANISM="Striatella unipunctata, Strain CCMP2910" /NCGR_SAMPLE_ID=MMETSP0800 /ASSEMBLY_ACC=CAM_ASM_000638 /LENGTH=183 /DNA_ID=CAMNT_0006573697 /DNA_START=73 /DNA_END=624 /DNA_ORIENTATION=-